MTDEDGQGFQKAMISADLTKIDKTIWVEVGKSCGFRVVCIDAKSNYKGHPLLAPGGGQICCSEIPMDQNLITNNKHFVFGIFSVIFSCVRKVRL